MLRLASFVLRGPNQATFAVLLLAGLSLFLPLVGLLSSACVALVALRKGFSESVRIIVFAAFAMSVAGVVLSGSLTAPLLYASMMWFPVWAVALLLRGTLQLGWALELGAGLGIGAIIAVYGMVPDPAAMWEERFRSLLAPISERNAGTDLTQIEQLGVWFSPYLTGIVAAGSVFSLTLSLFLARWWQACLFNPGGFSHEFLQVRLHKATHYLGLIGLLLAIADRTTAFFWNVLIVLSVLFIIQGLSIVHRTLAAKANRRFWLAGLYILALFVPQTLLPVALLGITDAWFDWRQRWT